MTAALPRRLARLDAAIAKTRHPLEVACLEAERAGFLARHGQLAQARHAIDEVASRFTLQPQASVSAWLNLAEAMHEYFGGHCDAAHDRLQRAHALAAAAGLKPLQALSAAWLAQIEVGRRDEARAVDRLAQALALAEPDDHAVHSRVGIVLSHAWRLAGRDDEAQRWHAHAHHHAVADGDAAALSALMHNRASERGLQARLAELFEGGAGDAGRQALMSAESSAHFDAGAGIGSLTMQVPMLRAQLLAMEGRIAEALSLFDEHFGAAMAQRLERRRAGFLADMAWCHSRLGHVEQAQRLAGEVERALDSAECAIDDRALAQARLANVWAALGDTARARALEERAQADLAAHRADCRRLAALLDAKILALKSG